MSLVNKIKEVPVGDIIMLENIASGLEVTGFVHEYSSKKIDISTTNPYNSPKNSKLFAWMHIGQTRNTKTYKLKYFHDYEILRKGES